MDEMRWPTLTARLRRRRIKGLRYDDAGFAVIELADGDALWVSADPEGCNVFELKTRLDPGFHSYRRTVASKLADKGASPAKMARAMGWSDERMALTYQQAEQTAADEALRTVHDD